MRVTGVLLFSFALFVGLLMIYHQGDGPIISQAQGPEMASKFECPDDPEAYLYDMLPAPQPDQSPAETYNAFNRTIVQPFLDNRCYAAWKRDKGVRDTGPFIDKQAYNTHSAVIIYYSPLTFKWLKEDQRRYNDLTDGMIIIKEQYAPPAAQYETIEPADVYTAALESGRLFGWSIMIRDSQASQDGWFWGGYSPGGGQPALEAFPYSEYPYGGLGQINACVRCHVIAADDTYTFSDLGNIEGEMGDSIRYLVDSSWRAPTPTPAPRPTPTPFPTRQPNPAFLSTFSDIITPVNYTQVVSFPNIIYDTVVRKPDLTSPSTMKQRFLTSNQCATCHGGLSGPPFGPVMYLPPSGDLYEGFALEAHRPGSDHSDLSASLQGEGINLSPSGEWRWSLMGLGGRDPIFFAQLESEMNLHPDVSETIQDTCLRCHGVMGQRQFHIDQGDEVKFTKDHAFDRSTYGALARDGISCTVCHQIETGDPLQNIDTGRFKTTPPNDKTGLLQVTGPFTNPTQIPMESSLGITPIYSSTITSSEVCASCHTIRLPVFDIQGRQVITGDGTAFQLFEQTTYLEWVNSSFAQGRPAEQRSCQDCHMPKTFPTNSDRSLTFKIAAIQDQDYPYSDNEAPLQARTVNPRSGFARHSLHGLNLFALEMFNQFDDILGLSKNDYMTGNTTDLQFAIDNYAQFALEETASVSVTKVALDPDSLTVDVLVSNETGHRFPSGVGFRRVFIELNVIDNRGNVVWASGSTNSLGLIVGPDGQPLPTEFLPNAETYQPHHRVITQPTQVQIYEELVLDPQQDFTTSFASRCNLRKDNRLLPLGWTDDEGKAKEFFPVYDASEGTTTPKVTPVPNSEVGCEIENSFKATLPAEDLDDDPDYKPGSNADTVTYQIALTDLPGKVNKNWRVSARIYYQAIPPYYLRDRFEAGRHPGGGTELSESQRLYYLASHLSLEDTPIEDWRLLVASDEVSIPVSTSASAMPIPNPVMIILSLSALFVGAFAGVSVWQRRR